MPSGRMTDSPLTTSASRRRASSIPNLTIDDVSASEGNAGNDLVQLHDQPLHAGRRRWGHIRRRHCGRHGAGRQSGRRGQRLRRQVAHRPNDLIGQLDVHVLRPRQRGCHRRTERDVLRQHHERRRRNDGRRPGPGDDPERRRANAAAAWKRRDQRGLRRRWQRRRHIHERLHRVVQPHLEHDQPGRLVGAVRSGNRHHMASHAAGRLDPPRQVLPGSGGRRARAGRRHSPLPTRRAQSR